MTIDLEKIREMAGAAVQHLNVGHADLAEPIVQKIKNVLPNDSVVFALETQIRLIESHYEALRESASLNIGGPIKQDAIDLAVFHVDLPKDQRVGTDEFDYMSVLRFSFSAAAKKAPGARRILLTDTKTEFPDDIGATDIFRRPLDTARLMYERLRLQIEYLAERSAGRASLLLDSDLVICRDVREIFQKHFDVGLTWRPGTGEAPFNGGVIAIGPGQKGLDFLTHVQKCYHWLVAKEELTGRFKKSLFAWWGDQYAIATLVGYREFLPNTPEAMRINGATVAFLPCDTYNFTVDPGKTYSTNELRQKFFLHFKGKRKSMMNQFVQLILDEKL